MTLACIATGTGHRGTILACHGVTDNAASLVDISERYGGDWRVVLVDSLGHGNSPRYAETQLAAPLEAAALELESLLEAEFVAGGRRPLLLYGHSMGGALATLAAFARPELLAGLVLDDPAWFTAKQAEQFAAKIAERLARAEQARINPDRLLAWCREHYPAWSEAERLGWAQGKAQCDAAFLATGEAGLRRPRRDLASKLAVATLIITGDGPDVLFGQDGAEELESSRGAAPMPAQAPNNGLDPHHMYEDTGERVSSFPGPVIRTAVLPGASHTVRRDAPKAFYAQMDSFIGELEASGAFAARANPTLRPDLIGRLADMPPQIPWDIRAMRAAGEAALGDVPPLPSGVSLHVHDIASEARHAAVARSLLGPLFAAVAEAEPAVVELRELSVAEPRRIVVSLHGGGFVAGAARYDDARNGELAERFQARVFCPEYRLAPEHPFPAGLADCLAALEYAREASASSGLPVVLYGDSAGAGLAFQATCALAATLPPPRKAGKGRGGASLKEQAHADARSWPTGGAAPFPQALILLEPCADPRCATASYASHARGPVWTARASRTAWAHYLGGLEAQILSPERIFSRADSRLFPPSFLAANFADPLRDEAVGLATMLADAGVRTELHLPAGTYHAEIGLEAILEAAVAFVQAAGEGA